MTIHVHFVFLTVLKNNQSIFKGVAAQLFTSH